MRHAHRELVPWRVMHCMSDRTETRTSCAVRPYWMTDDCCQANDASHTECAVGSYQWCLCVLAVWIDVYGHQRCGCGTICHAAAARAEVGVLPSVLLIIKSHPQKNWCCCAGAQLAVHMWHMVPAHAHRVRHYYPAQSTCSKTCRHDDAWCFFDSIYH